MVDITISEIKEATWRLILDFCFIPVFNFKITGVLRDTVLSFIPYGSIICIRFRSPKRIVGIISAMQTLWSAKHPFVGAKVYEQFVFQLLQYKDIFGYAVT